MKLASLRSLAFVTALLLASLSGPVRAQNTIPGVSFSGGDGSYDRSVENGISLALGNDYPYAYFDNKTNDYDGIDVQIYREITKRLGIKSIKWNLVSFDALIPGLLSKRWDALADNFHENSQRLAVVGFTGPAYWYGSALIVYKGNPKNLHTLDSLAGHTVGALRGTAQHQVLAARKDIKDLKLYTSSESEFADLAAQRIDAAIDDDVKVGLFIKQHPDMPIEFASGYEGLPGELGYGRYGLRKEDTTLNFAISRALAEMRADGTVGKILSQFGLSPRNLFYFTIN